MIFGSEGAKVTSTRPQGFGGRPALDSAVSSVQVVPPSAERNNPLPLKASGPSPPERKVQPLRRKSHNPARATSGFDGSSETLEQPVEALDPFRISFKRLPPSLVL